MELSLNEARVVQLAAQGLLKPTRKKATKADVLKEIRRMCGLQIDTISVVERSQYLVLWSGLGDYNTKWLEELHAEGELFEYYSHAACFVPIEDYTLYRFKMLEAANRDGRGKDLSAADQESLNKLQEHIRQAGELRSSDFDRVGSAGAGWWDWKLEKLALERLHLAGILMIAKREGFQRVYDLRECVHPDWDDSMAHSAEEARREFIIKLEPDVKVTRTLITDLAQTLVRCAAWHKTPEVVIRKTDPPELAALVSSELAKVPD